jgi:hypothetical protein
MFEGEKRMGPALLGLVRGGLAEMMRGVQMRLIKKPLVNTSTFILY